MNFGLQSPFDDLKIILLTISKYQPYLQILISYIQMAMY